MLLRAGGGFGALALAHLLGSSSPASEATTAVAGSAPGARAKSVIFLFMEGGPSHIDTFDPKPLVNKLAGQSIPSSIERRVTPMGEWDSPLLAAPRKWKQHGQSGLWVSDWLPRMAECADDLTVIRSCWADGLNHAGGVCQMNTGLTIGGRPSLGSWVTYGLGTENQNLPAFIVMQDNPAEIVNGPRNWGAGFMPAAYQGTRLSNGPQPIANLASPEEIGDDRQRRKLTLLAQMNRRHAAERPQQSELEARIRSYELAFRMQATAPEAVDIADETAATQTLYGLDKPETASYGRICLLARRLVERGVRFVQLYHGAGSKWDAHSNIEQTHPVECRKMDQPVAALLKDLKQRGLLDQTLVIWGGEFGRTPMSEKGNGRDHNPFGFTMWLAGGGLRGGRVIGATDEFGLHAVQDRLHVHDLHATILHLLGIDHQELVYLHKGRPERATLNEGSVASSIVAG